LAKSIPSKMPLTQKCPLRVALLGSGLFATSAHAPTLRSHPHEFTVVAVWSRRFDPANKLASTFPQEDEDCRAYSGPEGLDALLKRNDVEAIIMALPLDVQPEYVRTALQAGKHVLSEKPIAPTITAAKEVHQAYITKYKPLGLQWSIAENFRYEPGIIAAVQAAKHVGEPLTFQLAVQSPFQPDNKYLKTEWRTNPSWGDGGLFVDAFVHTAACVRMFDNPTKVSALLSSRAEHIPGMDTMAANVQFENGMIGTVLVTYAGKVGRFELEISGTEGCVKLYRRFGQSFGYTVVDVEGNKVDYAFGGIEAEFLRFAGACRNMGEDINTPEEALRDISLVEACLESGKAGGEMRAVGY